MLKHVTSLEAASRVDKHFSHPLSRSATKTLIKIERNYKQVIATNRASISYLILTNNFILDRIEVCSDISEAPSNINWVWKREIMNYIYYGFHLRYK